MTTIDLSDVRIRRPLTLPKGLPRHLHGEKFLKGPIPMNWLAAAARLPGRSLHVAIALWFTAGMKRSPTVSISNVAGEVFGLDRSSKKRALDWLEKEGLIYVDRKSGRSPIVTILESPTLARTDD